ncbi:MAG: endolytic transglycosylase MltG [Desulfuromonas sp.]|nr:MAG: endolytic transglycosylase MltG [Desulfuromonas sp.]
MKRHTALVLLATLASLAAVGLFAGFSVNSFLQTPVAPDGEQLVMIPAGSPLQRIAERLEKSGVIGNADYFTLLARWQGTATQVQAGEYLFAEPALPGEVLRRLVKGDVRMLRITLPEGLTLRETAQRMADFGLCSLDEALAVVANPELLERYDVPATSLEGYLFPETYTLRSNSRVEELVEAMLVQGKTRVQSDMLEAAKRRGLDRHQLVTLASIIQKEAGNNAEMPLISAVFHNRLRAGIPLQADPTVIYGVADFDGNLTRRHLATPTPYNTYQMRGLPAGPIANPGEAALRAAAWPAEVDYLYFVARGDGTHQFNTTLVQHNRAVRRYQLGR